MTNRVNALLVVLDADVREDHIALSQARHELRMRLWDALESKS